MNLQKNGILIIAHPSCVESMKNMGWQEVALQEKKATLKQKTKNNEE